jgi:hypothetical protein
MAVLSECSRRLPGVTQRNAVLSAASESIVTEQSVGQVAADLMRAETYPILTHLLGLIRFSQVNRPTQGSESIPA